jgi:glycosyltransferase involved in cell wall biosynthesis
MMLLKVAWVRFGVRQGMLRGGAVRKRQFTRVLASRVEVYLVTHEASYDWYKRLGIQAQPLYLVKARWAWTQNLPSIIFSTLVTLVSAGKSKESVHAVAARSHYLHDILPALRIALSRKAPFVVYIQSRLLPDPGGRSILNWTIVLVNHFLAIALIKLFADLVFVLNRYDGLLLERLGVSARKIRLIHHGIDWSKIPLENIEKRYDTLYFGSLSQSKGIFDLLDAWARVVRSDPDATLLIFGPGTQKDHVSVRKRVEELGIATNIVLKGFLPEETKYEMIRRSKIYVNPGYVDTWGIAIAEAMACRVPVVAYDLPTYRTVYGDAITTSRLGDVGQLAERILMLLNDDGLRMRMAEKAYQVIRDCSWPSALEEEFRDLVTLCRTIEDRVRS